MHSMNDSNLLMVGRLFEKNLEHNLPTTISIRAGVAKEKRIAFFCYMFDMRATEEVK